MNIHLAQGMSRADGTLLEVDAHISQSIRDILTTPIGSRLLRRQYGSLLPFLIDSPMTPAIRLRLMNAIATAVIKWEPRVQVRHVALSMNEGAMNKTGNAGLDIMLTLRRADNTQLNLSLSLTRGAS
ncbi:MAG: GPW/gp25 family protein [Moraxella sp.]|nr:GPW/gp25 family protein [Moraxella sp.]